MDKLEEQMGIDHLYVDSPSFYAEAFSFATKKRKQAQVRNGDNFMRVCAEEYDEISKRLDRTKFQESCAVRNVLRTRRLANLLINDKGELNSAVLPRLIALTQQHLYCLGPDRQYDAKRQEHLLNVLLLLKDNKELARLLNSIDKPISHKYAEQIIRDTLYLPANVSLTDAHARKATLAAWLCLLRQNVGSCFATAPCIIIHDEQPERFLKDIRDLLTTGQLKRVFGGVEYAVPLSTSWGAGDLKKPIYVPLGNRFAECDLWLSPGLAAAFESAGLLDKEASSAVKLEGVKSILQTVLSTLEWQQPFILISAEELIRKALLHNLALTEKDLKDYENRPKGMIHGGLLMHVSPLKGTGVSKSDSCASFLTLFTAACSAFKALADNALLKAWEFSIASFAETKAQFTRWNLYSSLGLGAQEQGGIGACLFEIIKSKLEQANQRLQEFQYEYEQAYHQLKGMEARMRSVSSDKEAQWLRIEYQSKRNEFYTLEDMRNDIHQRAQRFANLYDVLIDEYDALFPRYFQEVYDADMHDVSVGPYDDSPAGFRLLYKYGRSNTSQWSYIRTPNEFIEALASFFIATETEIAAANDLKGLQNELSEIVTAVVNHVRTNEFLESAFHRMAAAHQTRLVKNPLENLDQIEKKPWAYTSGGTMSTLVSCYYRRESKPTEVERWMENPMELCIFLVDTLKQMPSKLLQEYLPQPNKSILMHSPTHAFLLKPGSAPFKDAWQNDSLTYIWIRDTFLAPRQKFLEALWLDEEMMSYIVLNLAELVPEDHRHYFKRSFANIYGNKRPIHFREHLLKGLQNERGLRQAGRLLTADEIDSALYALLPLFPRSQLRERLTVLYAALPSLNGEQRQKLIDTFDRNSPSLMFSSMVDAAQLQAIAKGLLCLALGITSSPIDYHAIISTTAQQLGFAMPSPILFADTNWIKEDFGFVVNPGNEKFELWRVDATGRVCMPMSAWDQWLNGSRQDRTWGVYNRPYEYT